jgi:hypothetical protein
MGRPGWWKEASRRLRYNQSAPMVEWLTNDEL